MEKKAQPDVPAEASPRTRTATGTEPPARQPRRNTVDDVIESGEIIERRSLVIRSQRPADFNEEPTELAIPPLDVAPTRSWRGLWLAAGIVLGVVAVMGLGAKPEAGAGDALAARAEMIATTLDGEARAALVRAEAIASSPVLRAAITTDASTLADMARDRDLTFQLGTGDVIEVFQVRGTDRSLLLRLPADAAPLVAPAAGRTRIDTAKQALVTVASAVVTPDRAVAGEIVLSTRIDLTPVINRIAEHASGAQLTGLREPVVLLASGAKPNVTVPIAVNTPAAGKLTLAAVVPQATASWAYACMGLSVLSIGMFAFSVVRARRAAV